MFRAPLLMSVAAPRQTSSHAKVHVVAHTRTPHSPLLRRNTRLGRSRVPAPSCWAVLAWAGRAVYLSDEHDAPPSRHPAQNPCSSAGGFTIVDGRSASPRSRSRAACVQPQRPPSGRRGLLYVHAETAIGPGDVRLCPFRMQRMIQPHRSPTRDFREAHRRRGGWFRTVIREPCVQSTSREITSGQGLRWPPRRFDYEHDHTS